MTDRVFPLHPHEVTGLLNGSVTVIVRPIPDMPTAVPKGYYFDAYNGWQRGPYWNFWTPDHRMANDIVGPVKDTCQWKCPLQPGDTLVGKETWAAPEEYDDWLPSDIHAKGYWYKADGHAPAAFVNGQRGKWRSPLHQMPWASRIRVPVVSVKAKRVSEMAATEIEAWGIQFADRLPVLVCQAGGKKLTREQYMELANEIGRLELGTVWDRIYGTRYPWATSWAWLYEVGPVNKS